MKYVKMKIREHFIPLINDGIKKHEYRLADPKYADVHVGDVILLISNQNPLNYTKIVVDKIEMYKTWDEAFQDKWQDDFRGLFNTYDELIKECKRFYTKEEIDRYGIEVFTVKPLKRKFKKSRYLLDTNAIIERESFNNVSSEVSLVYKWIDKIHGSKIVHPSTFNEIAEYKDKAVKDSILKKLEAYEKIIPSTEKSKDFDDVCSRFSNDVNSQVDNDILLQVYNGTVDFLITSDNGILNKAKQLYIRENVLTPYEFLVLIEKENPKLVEYDVLSIKLVDIGTLNINDRFFDSLREDYGGSDFNKWLIGKNTEQAYVFKNKEGLQGFLYLKTEHEDENYSHFIPTFKPAIRLKVGTFKISQSGLRLGERFIKIIVDNAKKRNVDEVYVTLFEDKRPEVIHLKSMMEQWGFVKKAKNVNTGEAVLVKNMRNYNFAKDPKFNYPLQKNDAKITILPIVSQYHSQLFPDLHLRNEDMRLYDETACRYAIEKIYVCWSKINCNPGDMVCVYRMADYYKTYRSVVTGIGIIQEILYIYNEEDFVKECKNKSVFTESELRDLFRVKGYRTIIKTLFVEGFENKLNLKSLRDNGILGPNDAPKLNTFLTKQSFELLKKLGRTDR